MNLSFLNQNPDITTTQEFDYNSFYRAVVMGIDDPQHLGRIKVKIPALHSTTNNYPYAYPAVMSGMGYQTGQFILPPIGSIVFVGFEYGNEHRIIYFGSVPTTYIDGKEQSYGPLVNGGNSREVLGNDIPDEFTGSQAILYKSPSGQILYMDSNTYNRKVYLGAENGQALLMQTTLNDATDYSETNIVKLQYNDGSYIMFDNDGTEDQFHLFLNGEEVEFGGGGSSEEIFYEVVDFNGIDNTYTLPDYINVRAILKVYVNGDLLIPGEERDYTINKSEESITFSKVWQEGDLLTIVTATGTEGVNYEKIFYLPFEFNGIDNTYNLPRDIDATYLHKVYVNGDLLTPDVDYTADKTSQTITFTNVWKDKDKPIISILSSAGGGGTGRAEWGYITGDISTQLDLQALLNLKANDADISMVGKTNKYNDLDGLPTIPTKTSDLLNDSDFATTSQIPTKLSQLTNDSHFITSADIPTDVSAFNNDAGYLTTETDPTVPAWAKESTKPTYSKAEVGLGNVDNKSSETIRNEITSVNVTNALGYTPIDEAEKGNTNGVAELDSSGRVPSSQLPSYVDDVIEGYYNETEDKFYEEDTYTTEITPESNKVYISVDTNKTYRWSGTQYVIIGTDLALGETSSTAYRGDRGKIAYDHSQSPHAPANAQENIIESISVNGTTETITNKNVDITVPTVINVDSDSETNVYSCKHINNLLEAMKEEAFNFAHPIGSYYDTSDATWTPINAGWYGTWIKEDDGSTLVSYKSSGAFNKTPGTIVGSETTSYTPEGTNSGGAVGNHTLTVNEIPSHIHTTNLGLVDDQNFTSDAGQYPPADAQGTKSITYNSNATGGGQAHNHPFTQPTFTGTQANLSTIQTSKVVYRWHRTA